MKKYYRYLLLFLVFVFVLAFPLSVNAEVVDTFSPFPIYTHPELYPLTNLEEDIRNNFYYAQNSKGYYGGYRLEDMHVLVFQDARYPEQVQYVYCHKDNPLHVLTNNSTYSTTTQCGIGPTNNNIYRAVIVNSNGDMADFGYNYTNIVVTPAQGTIYYTNMDLLNVDGSFVVISADSDESEDDDYVFDWSEHIENFEDFMEENEEANNEIQQEELVTEEEEPNVFLRVFQNIGTMFENATTLLQNTRDMLSSAIGEFFTNTIPHLLQNAFNVILPDEVMSIFHELYISGLNSDGVFSLSSFFDYWLIPDEDFLNSQFEDLKDSIPLVSAVSDIGNSIHNGLVTLEPKSPVFTLHAGTYGVLVIEKDYTIDFNWFLPFKKYTDPIAAAFLYVGVAWRLYVHLPGILNGITGATPSTSNKNTSKKGD